MPFGLWIASVPLFALIPALAGGSAFSVLGLILLIPQLLLAFFVGGNTLRFLGQVLVTSSLGEVAQPRSPELEPQRDRPGPLALVLGVADRRRRRRVARIDLLDQLRGR